MVKLSVIIPVYNRCDCVKVMIDSILNQTFKNWELLLVDDGSNQETISLLSYYSSIDQRIIFSPRDRYPKGAQRCRNYGFELSKGEYVMFLDSDDYVPSYCFEKRIEYMEKHRELDFAVFPFTSFNYEPWDNPFQMCGGVYCDERDLGNFLCGSLPFVVWNNIYRRESLTKYHRIWDEAILSLQDADFNMQNILAGFRYDYANKENYLPDYCFRINNDINHISHKIKTIEHLSSHMYMANKTLDSLDKRWKKAHSKYVRWCLIHKFLLLRNINNKDYQRILFDISQNNNCYSMLRAQLSLYSFIVSKLNFNDRVAKNIVFFEYYNRHRRNRLRREHIVRQLMEKK